MKVVHVREHLYGLVFPYNPALINICKQVPGLRWDPAARAWVGYADAVKATCDLLEATGGIEVGDSTELTPDFRFDTGENDYARAGSAVTVAEKGLRDYQKAGVKWMLSHASEGCILAWEMGTGKSCAFLRFARALKRPTLIVCPSHVRGVWGDSDTSEVKRWWPEAWPPRVLDGTTPHRFEDQNVGHAWLHEDDPTPAVTVVHYDILHAWVDELTRYIRVVALDEVHYCASSKARRTEAAAAICKVAKYKVGLSGTPMTNTPKNLWSVVDTLSPERFGTRFIGANGKAGFPIDFRYMLRYCGGERVQVTPTKAAWVYNGSSNEGELNDRLKFFMSRVTKKEIASELPPQTRQLIDVDVKSKFVISPRTMLIPGKGDSIDTRALRRSLDLAADGKLPAVIEAVASHAEQGNNVVVFTHRRLVTEHIANTLTEAGIEAYWSHGGLPLKERERRIAACRRIVSARTAPVVFCATIDTTSTGIDLTFASVAVFAELTWEWWELAQAEARLHRPGAKNPVLVQYYLARGTSDAFIKKALLTKMASFENVIGGGKLDLKTDLGLEKERGSALKKLFAAIMAEEENGK